MKEISLKATASYSGIESKSAILKIITEPKFIARFERIEETYKGEFGFDWMRKEYMPASKGGKGICKDYESLKQEYTTVIQV